jgi:peptidoglycan-N-acetylglucosamine deacetylase
VAKIYGTLEGGREVLLTFDDGPHPKLTPLLLDALDAAGAKAVFFVLGSRVSAPGGVDLVKRAVAAGHVVGNHTWDHADLTKLDEGQVRDQITRTHDLIAPFLGSHPLFRPPYGAHNSIVDRVVENLGYHTMLWSVDSEDWKTSNKPDKWIVPTVETIRLRGHSVCLCHDIHASTVQNIGTFLAKLKALPSARFISYA